MPRFGPIHRTALVRARRRAGFVGPEPGGKHTIMRRGPRAVPIPNPHGGDISRPLFAVILKQVGTSRDEWENL